MKGAFAGALLLLAALLPASAQSAGRKAVPSCRISLTAAADGSFAQAGHEASPARLSKLAALTAERFTAAARRLCAAGAISAADLARFEKLVVQNGEGATEPLLYREPDMPPRTFIFQFAFQDGGPPEPAAFEQALRCWKRPRSAGCDLGD
jgi:hypothetical protein